MASDFQRRELELTVRNNALRDSQSHLVLGRLSGQEEQDFYDQRSQWILVEAELSALYNTGYTSYAMSPSAIEALQKAARALNQLIKADAAARNILDSVASIMQSFVATQSQAVASSSESIITQPLLRSIIAKTRGRLPALDDNQPVDDDFQRRELELSIRNNALRDSQSHLVLGRLSGQEEQDFYDQRSQWILVQAELSALYSTGYTSYAMSPSEIDALQKAARELNQLINANAAARNVLNSVAAIMRSYVPSQSSAALADPKVLPPKSLLMSGLAAAEGTRAAHIWRTSSSAPAAGRYYGNTPELDLLPGNLRSTFHGTGIQQVSPVKPTSQAHQKRCVVAHHVGAIQLQHTTLFEGQRNKRLQIGVHAIPRAVTI